MNLSDFRYVIEPPRCTERRGPGSRIQCEKNAGHIEEHAARGRLGQWFFWPSQPYGDSEEDR